MSNYTVEGFETWLKADKSHAAGLKGWWWILKQIKSDADLRAALIHGNDQGGWNFSDPEWRKKWRWGRESFDDYYQVFLKYKAEVDGQPENEEQNSSSNNFTPSSENNNDKSELEEPEKKWKEGEKELNEESAESSLPKNNWPWGKIGLGAVIILLIGIFFWAGKKVISWFF